MAERKKEGKGFNAEGAEGTETECLTEGWRCGGRGHRQECLCYAIPSLRCISSRETPLVSG